MNKISQRQDVPLVKVADEAASVRQILGRLRADGALSSARLDTLERLVANPAAKSTLERAYPSLTATQQAVINSRSGLSSIVSAIPVVAPAPSASPTPSPTASPTAAPSATPTVAPSPATPPVATPTATPSPTASPAPTTAPRTAPVTPAPAATPAPSATPTGRPTVSPSTAPTPAPTGSPAVSPATTSTGSPAVSPTSGGSGGAAPAPASSPATPSGPGVGARVKSFFSSGASKMSSWWSGMSPRSQKLTIAGAVITLVAAGYTIYAMSDKDIADQIEKDRQETYGILKPALDYSEALSMGFDIEDYSDADKENIVNVVFDKVGANDTRALSPEGLAEIIASQPSAKAESVTKEGLIGNVEYKAILGEVSRQLLLRGEQVAAATEGGSGGGGGGGTPVPKGGGGGGRSGSTISGTCLESSSEIMVAKGYLASKKTTWDAEFEAAFCDYVNAGQTKVKMEPGKTSWTSVAATLGYTPDLAGACDAVKNMMQSVPNKGAAPAAGGQTPAAPGAANAPVTPASPTALPKQDVLAQIISVLYNEKLVGIKGLDLANEKKQITAIVDAAGGPAGGGFSNAAQILLRQNPAIAMGLPEQLTGPVDKEFVKANSSLAQAIVRTTRNIFEKANPSLINPRLEKATENVREYLGRVGYKLTTVASYAPTYEQLIMKKAEDRKDRIRAKMAEQLTPEERVAARRMRIRESM